MLNMYGQEGLSPSGNFTTKIQYNSKISLILKAVAVINSRIKSEKWEIRQNKLPKFFLLSSNSLSMPNALKYTESGFGIKGVIPGEKSDNLLQLFINAKGELEAPKAILVLRLKTSGDLPIENETVFHDIHSEELFSKIAVGVNKTEIYLYPKIGNDSNIFEEIKDAIAFIKSNAIFVNNEFNETSEAFLNASNKRNTQFEELIKSSKKVQEAFKNENYTPIRSDVWDENIDAHDAKEILQDIQKSEEDSEIFGQSTSSLSYFIEKRLKFEKADMEEIKELEKLGNIANMLTMEFANKGMTKVSTAFLKIMNNALRLILTRKGFKNDYEGEWGFSVVHIFEFNEDLSSGFLEKIGSEGSKVLNVNKLLRKEKA